MDYVHICRGGTNEELRYSLRSIVKNSNVKNVYLIGQKPEWYVGNFINVSNISNKFNNIKNCIKSITNIDEISNDFILMNDDFFFLNPVEKVPVYHGGFLKEKIDAYSKLGASGYSSLLRKTYKDLIKHGIKNPLDYDIHVPMPMNKKLLAESIDKVYFPRSGYGNINNIGGELINDVKVYSNTNILSSRSFNVNDNNIKFLSTEDNSFNFIYNTILKDMFPEESKFERNA